MRENIKKLIEDSIKFRSILKITDIRGNEIKDVIPLRYDIDGFVTLIHSHYKSIYQFTMIDKIEITGEYPKDKRLLNRYTVEGNTLNVNIGSNDNKFISNLIDISQNGLGLLLKDPFRNNINDHDTLVINLLYKTFDAQVMYVNEDLQRVGVHFDYEIGEEIISLLEAYPLYYKLKAI